ncbi:MAG: alpha/beta fold hydrolase [Acidimicrobiia bacterium]
MSTLVTADGLELHVRVAGRGADPSVVLVHGLAGSVALSWEAPGVIDALVRADTRVVAFDRRGHGASDAPAVREYYAQSRFVDDLFEVVASFADPDAVVVGYSLGAALTLLALERGLAIRAAVVAGTAASVLEWTDEDERRRVATIQALEGSPDVDGDLVAYVAFFRAIGANLSALALLLADHRPVAGDWAAITTPITVVAGVDDTLAAPPEEVAARLRGAPVVRVPGDHVSAPWSPEFVDLVVAVAHGAS